MPNTPTPLLSPVEARVLAVLVEKQRAVPDTYPLSLNALVAGCNQKTSRDPVMELNEAEVQAAIDRLKAHTLVIKSSGGRVMRYAHNIEKAWQIPSQSAALLAVLMLRGPQTAGELRLNCERLHRFADISAVEGFLQELAQRPAGALVAELPRQPGARESRWTHLLCGALAPRQQAAAAPAMAGDRGDGFLRPRRAPRPARGGSRGIEGPGGRATGESRRTPVTRGPAPAGNMGRFALRGTAGRCGQALRRLRDRERTSSE